MKRLLSIYRFFISLKILSIGIAGLLNVAGLYLMTKGFILWDSLILYSVFVLGGTLIFSVIASYSKKKLFQKSLDLFLKTKNIDSYRILRQIEQQVLIETNEQLFTIQSFTSKEGITFIITPAFVTWDSTLIKWDENHEERTVQFMPGWSLPEWLDKEKLDKEKNEYIEEQEQKNIES